jgi:hypothetical protein
MLGIDPWVLGAVAAATTGIAYRQGAVRRRRRAIDAALQLGPASPNDVGMIGLGQRVSPALARLVDGARMTRWAIETPLRRLRSLSSLALPRWASRGGADAYDLAISEARRALWEWLVSLRRLPPAERAALAGLGLDARPLWALVFAPGVFERTDLPFDEALFPAAPDADRVLAALTTAMIDLQRFEHAAASLSPTPYR